MTKLLTASVIAAVVMVGESVHAQRGEQARPTPPPVPQRSQAPPAPQPPPPSPAPAAGPVNVRIDINVIDEGGPEALRERVTLTTVEGQEASLRSDGDVQGVGPVILNVDATPQISGLPSGKVRVRLALDYLPSSADQKRRAARTRLQLAVIVDDGKTLVASDTSDPATDRRVRVEVTATILK